MSRISEGFAPKVSWLLWVCGSDGLCRIWEGFVRVREAVIQSGQAVLDSVCNFRGLGQLYRDEERAAIWQVPRHRGIHAQDDGLVFGEEVG